jgi:type IV secretion system protein TrbB
MVAIHPFQSEAISRGARMLRTALGPAIVRFLDDPVIVEVMLNPDGRLWIDRLSCGLIDTGERLSAPDGERIVRLVAHHVGSEVHAAAPRISAELPETGERFEGLLPLVVAAPAFAIRKPAVTVFTLKDYVAAGIMNSDQASALKGAVEARKNILVAGGPRAARRRSQMRCWRKSPRPQIELFSSKTRESCSARRRISSHCVLKTA